MKCRKKISWLYSLDKCIILGLFEPKNMELLASTNRIFFQFLIDIFQLDVLLCFLLEFMITDYMHCRPLSYSYLIPLIDRVSQIYKLNLTHDDAVKSSLVLLLWRLQYPKYRAKYKKTYLMLIILSSTNSSQTKGEDFRCGL